ncbi:hypothetical protein JQN58_34895 [Aneurinibacillus sp. BA2021]|nr:hypothetical protein [Aneurinibacillus sp. BA2021]
MTGSTSIADPRANRTLLVPGVESTAATPPPTRRDPGWDEYSAAYLRAHPEVSAAAPAWTEELEFLDIEDEVEGTVFSFSRTIRDVELYGGGRLHPDGRVELYDNGVPNIYIREELRADEDPDVARWATDVAEDLVAAALLLKSEPRFLKRDAATEEALREREQ